MRHRELFDKYLTGELTPEEEIDLVNFLSQENNKGKLSDYIIETNMMVNSAENIDAFSSKPINSSIFKYLSMAVAAILIVGFIIISQNALPKLEVVASSGNTFKIGTYIEPKHIDLGQGSISLKMTNGTILKLKAPTKISAISDKRLTLVKGYLNVKLAENIKSFEVITPQGIITDLGTAFGLAVRESSSEVHVYEGKIELKTSKTKTLLIAGDALLFERTGNIRSIPYQPDIMLAPELISLESRELRPGGQMDIHLGKGAKSLQAQVKLKYDSAKEFKYKVIGYSNKKKIYESSIHGSDDSFSLNMPFADTENVTIEMKVTEGYVKNGILILQDMALRTYGERPYIGTNVIPANSKWHYLYKESPSENWLNVDFSTDKWEEGAGTIGYGDFDLKTKIGPDSLRKSVSKIYFRKEFQPGNMEIMDLDKIKINLLVDDGAVIFLNGKEVIRYNISDGELNDDTRAQKRAGSHSGEMIYRNFSIPARLLNKGTNTIGIILYQINSKSSDMRFDLQMSIY